MEVAALVAPHRGPAQYQVVTIAEVHQTKPWFRVTFGANQYGYWFNQHGELINEETGRVLKGRRGYYLGAPERVYPINEKIRESIRRDELRERLAQLTRQAEAQPSIVIEWVIQVLESMLKEAAQKAKQES